MKRIISILIMAAVLFTFLAVPTQVAADNAPFWDTPVKEEKTVRGDEDIDVATVTTTTIDTIADISDACSGRDNDSDSSADKEDKKTFSEMLGGNKDDNSSKKSDTGKTDSSSDKKDSDSEKTGWDRLNSNLSNEKAEKLGRFASKYMKSEGSSSDFTTDEALDNSELHPEDAESFREFNLKEEKGQKPEDFSGSYKESRGDDGSVTYMYDSGTIITRKTDGTTEGFDYTGRRISSEKDGTLVTHYSDGSEAKVYTDGRKEFYDKSDDSRTEIHDDGSYTTYYTDGSRTEVNEDGSGTYIAATGIRSDFAEDGSDNGVYYFDGGGSVKVTDDNGDFIVGEHTLEGPNGEKFTYSNTIDFNKEFKDGETFEGKLTMTFEGNGKASGTDMYLKQSDQENILTIDRKGADGSTLKVDGRSKDNEDGSHETSMTMDSVAADGSTLNLTMNGNDTGNGKEGKFEATLTIRDADGSTGDIHFDTVTDKDGNSTTKGTIDCNNADGSYIKGSIDGTKDKDSSSFSMNLDSRDEDGSELKIDCNLKENADGTGSMDMNMSTYDAKAGTKSELKGSTEGENGHFTYHEEDKDGNKIDGELKGNEDGGSFSVKETDKDGNVKSFDFNVDSKAGTMSAISNDGSFFKMDKDGKKEMENKKNGCYIRTDKNNDIEACHLTLPGTKSSYDFKDGTGLLIDEKTGEKLMWMRDENNKLLIISPSSKYTVDENGNLYHNGEPVRFNGDWVNVDKGINPDDPGVPTEEPTEEETEEPTEEETEEPEPTDPPTEPPTEKPEEDDIDSYLGKWSHPGSVSTTWTLSMRDGTLYLAIGGYSTDPNEKVEAPCTYEFHDGKLYVSSALFSGTAVFTYNSSNSVTVTANGETVAMTR